jgi:NADPH:quinone reductase-like Zn-dependent oxidoreductase
VRAAAVTGFGGPEVLREMELPDPVPADGEVRVRIHAATINPSDMATRAGAMRHRMPDLQPPFVLGWDLAGEVDGQRVVGMVPFGRIGGTRGTYGELAAVDPDWLAPLGDDVDFVTGATLPLNALTARQCIDLLDAEPGATVLITGASGAVGGYAVQLAVRDGYRVIALAGRDDEDWPRELGAHEVLPRDTDLASIERVDAVLDLVPIGPACQVAARDGGEVVFTRSPGDEQPERGITFKPMLVNTDPPALRALADDMAAGRLKPSRVAQTFDLAEAARGHELAERGGLHGKVVLTS